MKTDKFIDVTHSPKETLLDGVYHAKFPDGFIYRVEKRGDQWVMADGTGWGEPIHPEEKFRPLLFYPEIKITPQKKLTELATEAWKKAKWEYRKILLRRIFRYFLKGES